MKGKNKKKVVINKEETAENWCFVCKDGGDLRICDYKQCLKSFHPCCVGKDDSFLDSNDHWACAWHYCFICRRSSNLHCYTCANAVCHHCWNAGDFSQFKGKYGFCKFCLKLALLIEEEKDYDSDGAKVDFTDRETYEGLFKEYYYIIKKQEGFESRDLYAAKEGSKKTANQFASGSEESDEEEEDQVSDYDVEYVKECRRTRKQKRSKREKPATQTSMKSKKNEFIGWASRSLIEFLTSIGKSTNEKLSQHDVTSIVNEYVKENKLLHPEKRKIIICDARLQPLFRRRTISRYRVYELLEAHFAENYDESEEDDLGYDSGDDNAGIQNVCKRQRKLDMVKRSPEKELEDNVPQSCFASVVVENIKLVYLRRSLLLELCKQPESFEEKVIGCFVRVKSDPYDYYSRNSHQLMQIKGVKTVSIGENNMKVFLLFSSMPKEICMSLVSDDDFSEEECEDLRQKVLAGQLERPTVVDLQQKAKILHEDLTKHWINRELALLRNLIDRANEKGWRRELFEYLEKKKRLETPMEQSKLLANVPTVIPDVDELNSSSGDSINDRNSEKGSPGSILQCNSSVPSDGCQDDKASEEKTPHGNAPPLERSVVNLVIEPAHSHPEKTPHGNAPPLERSVVNLVIEPAHSHPENSPHGSALPPERKQLISEGSVVNLVIEPAHSHPEKTPHGSVPPPERKQLSSEGSVMNLVVEPPQSHPPDSELKHDNITSRKPLLLSAELKENKLEGEELEMRHEQATKRDSKIEVIEVLTDDENGNDGIDDLECKTWCIRGPDGEEEKCSLSVLRRWSETSPYASKFKVWKEDENEENAIWLREAISIAFPTK